MSSSVLFGLLSVGLMLVIITGFLTMVARFYRTTTPGRALVIQKVQQSPTVAFSGALVLPLIHAATEVDLGQREVSCTETLKFRNGARAKVSAVLRAHIPRERRAVLTAIDEIGPERLQDEDHVRRLLEDHVRSALRIAASRLSSEEVVGQPENMAPMLTGAFDVAFHGFALEGTIRAVAPAEETTVGEPVT